MSLLLEEGKTELFTLGKLNLKLNSGDLCASIAGDWSVTSFREVSSQRGGS